MKNNIKNISVLLIPIILILLWIAGFIGIFEDQNIRKAEKKFSQMNAFSIEIRKIDTITNEQYAKILKKDFVRSEIMHIADSLLQKPKEIHHYRLSAVRKQRGRKKYHSPNIYSQFEFAAKGGLVVNRNFKQIENPLQYRFNKLLDEIHDNDKLLYEIRTGKKMSEHQLGIIKKSEIDKIDLSNFEFGKTEDN